MSFRRAYSHARDLPLSFDGGDRAAQDEADFFEREPAEKFQFGDLALGFGGDAHAATSRN